MIPDSPVEEPMTDEEGEHPDEEPVPGLTECTSSDEGDSDSEEEEAEPELTKAELRKQAKAAKKARKAERMRRSAKTWHWEPTQRIACQQKNPKDVGTKTWERYERYKSARTV